MAKHVSQLTFIRFVILS